ncbi:PDZ domain-containing protein [Sphingomonas glacialis]|uniref:PDZ domain-containing protein n=1 Tax=Sphingomonas glacialis TaxID=658225 RepID=A0A502FQB5_9SPHN|nr:PDZ domain-containing protein [Sphingomonas glacialis]
METAPFQRLWYADRLLPRARYPNYDPAKLPLGGVSADATSAERIARWKNPAGGIVQALHSSRWGSVHIPILGKNADGTLRLGPAVGNAPSTSPSITERFVENIREELDAPGEWYHDVGQNWLYFKPPVRDASPPPLGFRASTAESLIQIVGAPGAPAHNIRIAGIGFRGTEPTFLKSTEPLLRSDWRFYRGGALFITDAERIGIEDDKFHDLGGNAIVVSGHARGVSIRRNLIDQIGASAISFVGEPQAVRLPPPPPADGQLRADIDRTTGPRSDQYPADSIAQDNLIHDVGTIEKQSAGVEIAMSARITIDHNSIYRVPRAGINIGDGNWGGHRITNNDVFDTVRESSDHGAFNSWGRDRYWQSDRPAMERATTADRAIVRLDTLETIVLRHNRFRSDHGWDIDLDDGSTNYLIEDNLLLAGGLKLREGFDRTARNNIILNNSFHPHMWFTNSNDVFEHNIVMAGYQPVIIKRWGKAVDFNLFVTASDLKTAQSNETDLHSLSGDPQFISSRPGDYAVRPTSPAIRIGYHNIAMGDFGVRPQRLRALAERPAFPKPELAPAPAQRGAPRAFAGMMVKTVSTLGEQSAAGLAKQVGVLVLSVKPDSAAATSGLRPGDVILTIEGTTDILAQAVTAASSLIATAKARQWQGSMVISVFRNQQIRKVSLPLQ